jgi:hypothetical protein
MVSTLGPVGVREPLWNRVSPFRTARSAETTGQESQAHRIQRSSAFRADWRSFGEEIAFRISGHGKEIRCSRSDLRGSSGGKQ